jgi:hypothetical protein
VSATEHLYSVKTEKFGTLLKVATNIAAARAWAKGSFPGSTVTRFVRRREPCASCESRPCCCDRRAGERAHAGTVDHGR